jgi:glutamate/tyrosine decarboxylase-like PLP-dependent enzyme
LLAEGISSIEPLFVMTKPDSTLICFGSGDESVPTNAVADALRARGWWVDRQGPPATLHMTVSAHHEHVVADFIEALRLSVTDVRSRATAPGSTVGYGTVE